MEAKLRKAQEASVSVKLTRQEAELLAAGNEKAREKLRVSLEKALETEEGQ